MSRHLAFRQDKQYWDIRYEKTLGAPPDDERGPLFDWLATPDALQPRLDALRAKLLARPHCDGGLRVLDMGCGNSLLAERLAAARCAPSPAAASDSDDELEEGEGGDGERVAPYAYASVDAIDFSPSCVTHMETRAAAAGLKDRLHYAVMDARAMTYPDRYFDLIVDKGCFDAALVRS